MRGLNLFVYSRSRQIPTTSEKVKFSLFLYTKFNINLKKLRPTRIRDIIMKKLFLGILSILFTTGLFAQQQEFGIVAGGLNGLSYKRIMSETFAIQTDLAVGFQRTSAMAPLRGGNIFVTTFDIFDFALNANFLYNKELQNGLYAFIGGGPNIGLVQDLPYANMIFAKFGANAMLGAGYKMSNIPLTFSLDFRPGYAFLLNYRYETILHMLDWHLALGVRYCF